MQPIVTPLRRSASIIASHSARQVAIGFSTTTFLPASIAWIAISAWVYGGVHTWTMSMARPEASIFSWSSKTAQSRPYFSFIACAFSG